MRINWLISTILDLVSSLLGGTIQKQVLATQHYFYDTQPYTSGLHTAG